ncbi:hypothetical protein [Micromonospora inyonensis]|uniref:Uncharacterized protein n=1 Tax=Micromonospora inyonensis TaxID=47866 RepID=A0A1C6R8T2_9ACTN|nr:hypothetical protein [Micromonospora inyonensis]SCL13493.1 hypothetical protein GA0074694_0361 [Micromonospora inyonensis]
MRVDVVVPLLLVLMLALVLLATARGRFSIVHDTSRPYFWLLVVFWLMLADD